MKNEAIPRLRFRGFHNNWIKTLLGNMTEVFDGMHQTPNYVHSGVPFISVENIKSLKTNKYITEQDFIRNYKRKMPSINDIIMTRIGSIGEVNILKHKDVAYYVTLALIHPDNNNLESYYLLYLLQSTNIQRELWRRTLQVAFPQKINKNEIPKIPIKLPSLPEQQLIGKFFAKLDKLIQLQQEKVSLLKKLKQGYLQKLFPRKGESVPRIRFKGFHKKWNIKSLNTLYNRCDNLRKPITATKRITGNTPYYGANGIEDYVRGYTCDGTYILVAEDGASSISNYPVYITHGKIWVNNHTHILSSKKFTSIAFLAYAIKQINMRTYLVGGGRLKLRSNDLMGIPLRIPSLLEQRKIGDFFDNIENCINQSNDKLNCLRKLKKAYLQKMFC